MARLNLEKAIANGYKNMNDRYSLVAPQISQLAKKPLFDAICDSFAVGYYQGMKAAMKKNGGKVK